MNFLSPFPRSNHTGQFKSPRNSLHIVEQTFIISHILCGYMLQYLSQMGNAVYTMLLWFFCCCCCWNIWKFSFYILVHKYHSASCSWLHTGITYLFAQTLNGHRVASYFCNDKPCGNEHLTINLSKPKCRLLWHAESKTILNLYNISKLGFKLVTITSLLGEGPFLYRNPYTPLHSFMYICQHCGGKQFFISKDADF